MTNCNVGNCSNTIQCVQYPVFVVLYCTKWLGVEAVGAIYLLFGCGAYWDFSQIQINLGVGDRKSGGTPEYRLINLPVDVAALRSFQRY